MAGLKFLLGMLPSTSKVEETDIRLRKEYEDYQSFEKSDALKRYLELEQEVNSSDFASRKKQVMSRKFNQTNEYKKLVEFKALDKSRPIKNYFRVKDSKKLADFLSFSQSDTLRRYKELEEFVKSDALSQAKGKLSPKEYKRSEEAAKEKEFKKLRKSGEIKKYFKFLNSASYHEFKRIEGSDELKKYQELKEFVNSEKFREVKEYMSLSPKKKYELSGEFKKEQEYRELKKSEQIIWYFKTKKNYPFREIEKWELTFEDTFETGKLNQQTWLTRYYYGDKILDKNYVMGDDKHFFTDGKNIEFYDNKLRILTKREQAKGLVWHPMQGFYEKDFAFTSGVINTGKSFRQKYGLIKAKAKIGNSGVSQSFSLLAEQMLPHVDVFRFEKNKLFAGNFWKNGSKTGFTKSLSKTGGRRYTNDYFIYSLEWQPGKMIWKINDVVFKEQSAGVPDQDMYLLFNASLKENAAEAGLPSALEIDWVRAYKLKPRA